MGIDDYPMTVEHTQSLPQNATSFTHSISLIVITSSTSNTHDILCVNIGVLNQTVSISLSSRPGLSFHLSFQDDLAPSLANFSEILPRVVVLHLYYLVKGGFYDDSRILLALFSKWIDMY